MKIELERSRDRHGDAGEKNVELSGLQRRQALLRRGIRELHFVRIVENGDRQRSPEVDKNPSHLPFAFGEKNPS